MRFRLGRVRPVHRRVPLDGRALFQRAVRAQHPGADGPGGRVELRFPRPRRARALPVLRGALAAACSRPAGRHGVERQARHALGRAHHGLRGRRGRLWRARHHRPALLLPAAAHGPNGPCRLHWLRAAAPPDGSRDSGDGRIDGVTPRRADGELLRAARRARLRPLGGRAARSGRVGRAGAAPHLPWQPPIQRDHAAAAHALLSRPDPGAVRAPHRGAGLCVGDQLLRPVGCRARQAARRGGAHRDRRRARDGRAAKGAAAVDRAQPPAVRRALERRLHSCGQGARARLEYRSKRSAAGEPAPRRRARCRRGTACT
mmetsp:Transcript_18011/g.46543  ORF Transcript_18011/g.46543 Transcript_18011/m.46543 type:complete len:316 (-) Transcript_18011:53-1000(-)